MQEIHLSDSSDSFDKLANDSTDSFSFEKVNRKSSESSFLEVNFEDCLPENQFLAVKSENPITNEDIDDLLNILDTNPTDHLPKPIDVRLPPVKTECKCESVYSPKPQDGTRTREFVTNMMKQEDNIAFIYNKTPKIEVISTQENQDKDLPLIIPKTEQKATKKRKSKYELLQEKKQKRLIRNRESAKLHRERQKMQQKKVLDDLSQYKNENASLRATISHLLEENLALKAQLAARDEYQNACSLDKRRIEYFDTKRSASTSPFCEPNGSNITEDNVSMKIDTSSILSHVVGSSGASSENLCSYQADMDLEMSEVPLSTDLIANDEIKHKRSTNGGILLFGFSFLLFFFSFGEPEVEQSVGAITAGRNYSWERHRNLTKRARLLSNSQELSITLEPIEIPVTSDESNSGDFFLPFNTGHLRDIVRILDRPFSRDNYAKERALVLKTAYENTLTPEIPSSQKILWQELKRLNNMLQAKPIVQFDGKTSYLDSKSTAITVYSRDEASSSLEPFKAVQTALKTYVSFLADAYKTDHKRVEQQPNYILCPSAYGAIEKVSSRDSAHELQKERSFSLAATQGNIRSRYYGSPEDSITNASDLKDTVLNFILPASYPVENSEESEKVVMELSCRVEDVKEYLVPRQ